MIINYTNTIIYIYDEIRKEIFMVSEKVKEIIKRSNMDDLFHIDNQNNTLYVDNLCKIVMEDETRGKIQMYLGAVYNGRVYFNGLDSCYAEGFSEEYSVNAGYLQNTKMMDNRLIRLFDFFHVVFYVGLRTVI